MSERDDRAKRLFRVWSAHSRSLGNTTLSWRRLGHDLREGWRLVGDAAVGLPPVPPPPEIDLTDLENLFGDAP